MPGLNFEQTTQTPNGSTPPNSSTGPLSSLEGDSYSYTTYQYPLMSDPDYPTDNQHVILFNINIPQESFWNTQGSTNSATPVANQSNVNAAQFGLRSPGTIGQGVGNVVSGATSAVLQSKTVRSTSAIALYVPNNMIYTHDLDYETVSLTDALGPVGDALYALSSAMSGKWKSAVGALSSVLPDALKYFGANKLATGIEGSRDASLAALGIADNPQNFLLFKQIGFRKYQYEFILTPTNAQEASMIWQIIYLFRFHSVPEIASGSVGRFFVPPSQFDITFLHNGVQNPFLPYINTCVLNNISVDYAGAGIWSSTYDGFPLQIKMNLAFTEVSILTKDLIQLGF